MTAPAAAAPCWCGRGKRGRRREVGMDDCAWEHMQPWLTARREPRRPLFGVTAVRHAAGTGHSRRLAHSCATPRRPLASAAVSLRISVARTLSSSPVKGCRS